MKQVGEFTPAIIQLLNLSVQPGTPIYIGIDNEQHIADEHPEDYHVYFPSLEEILLSPDWIIPHPRDFSLQFVKRYEEILILVPIKQSKSGRWFVRSLYCLSEEKIATFNTHDLFTKYRSKE